MRRGALWDVDLVLERGRIYALLGTNGSGKTTFMKMVAGLIKPTSGTVTFNNDPIGVESKKIVAYMSTEPFFYAYMTIKDVGKYFADFFEDFSPILHDFEDAMKNNDTVLIGDLSEYEICPRLKSISEALKQF